MINPLLLFIMIWLGGGKIQLNNVIESSAINLVIGKAADRFLKEKRIVDGKEVVVYKWFV